MKGKQVTKEKHHGIEIIYGIIYVVLLGASIIGFKVYSFEKLKKEPTMNI